jgi:oxalate decarboxylase/phosphoglucose isomerase-like protein (cupin superfamily)
MAKYWLGDMEIIVKAGDLAYVPRWYDYNTANTGDALLKILALTDYDLTRCFASNTERSYRQQPCNVAV